jgi:hypothetical protein
MMIPIPRTTRTICAIVLATHALLLAWMAKSDSPTWDELGHLPAGLSHWEFGSFELFPVNPPLVRMVAALPVLATDAEPYWTTFYVAPGKRPEFGLGLGFIAVNKENWFDYFALARWACIPFSLLGAWLCFRWARELYGVPPGCLALALWCFCPNALGHGHLITADVGAAALGVAAGYTFWRWLKHPGWKSALIAGGVLGFCQLTKSTWIILFALWPLLHLVYHWRRTKHWRQLAAILLLALYVLNLGYGFEGTFTSLGEFDFITKEFAGTSDGKPGNRFRGSTLSEVPLPLPKNYILGIDYQKRHFEMKLPSYLAGEWKRGGWWYYYLYALAIKVPLGTWLLALLAVGVTVWDWRRKKGSAVLECEDSSSLSFSKKRVRTADYKRATQAHGEPKRQQVAALQSPWRDEFVLLAPAIAILVFVSSQTGFNHHLRYVLPAFPFAFIWISKVGRIFETANDAPQQTTDNGQRTKQWRVRTIRGVVAGALAWSIVSSLSAYPHSLSYFNELVGGPKNGHWHLANSNTDWGQDLLYLKRWYDEHPQARPLGVGYDNIIDPRVAGIENAPIPRAEPKAEPICEDCGEPAKKPTLGPRPGWFAISVNRIQGRAKEYRYFLEFEPVDWIGYTMPVYHITLDEANRVRRKLGLPTLSE